MTLESTYDFAGTDKKVLQNRKWSKAYYWRHRGRINTERREKHACHCSCGTIFRGSGCWQQIRRHREMGHEVMSKVQLGGANHA